MKNNKSENLPVVVLGMHRSGTSLIGNILSELGVNMGNSQVKPHESNPYGHFEDTDFVELNEKILSNAGGAWDNVPPGTKLKESLNFYSNEIKDLINKQSGLWGWKDPRTSLTFSGYYPFLAKPRIIIVEREMKDVSKSLHKRNNMPIHESSVLYRQYNEHINKFIKMHDVDYLKINFGELQSDAVKKVEEISKFLGLNHPRSVITKVSKLIKTPEQVRRRSSELLKPGLGIYKMPRISVVVLNWNGKEDTKLCINSLRTQNYDNYEIIVVDNGSTDGSKQMLESVRDITYISLPSNTGFTGGQLAAIKRAEGDFIALLNNDAVVAEDWLSNLYKTISSDPLVAAVGGRAYFWNNIFAPFNTSNPFYSYQIIDPKSGHAETLMSGEEVVSVNAISGAGLLIKRSALDNVGYFDDRFFAYYEETDLFARLKRAGNKVAYTPHAHTWHKIAASTKNAPDFYLYQMQKNRFLFAVKNFETNYLIAFIFSYLLELIVLMSKPIARKVELLIKIRAILWNILHLFPTLISRKYTSRLGPSYNSMLFDDANEVITVVIPCYNYANFVEEAVDSVLLQTVSPKQIIIINDGSTDNTSRVLNKYKDNKKIQIVNRGNKGVVATKNEGARLATGTWLMFLDADDRIPRNYLALLLKSARLTKKDVIYTDAKYFGAKRGIQSGRRFSIRTLRKGNYIHNSALIKKALFDKCGGYDAAMSGAYEDWELYLSLYEVGAGFHYSKDTALDYRKHENEIGRNVLAPNVDLHYKLIIKQLHPKLYGHGYLIDLYLFSVLRKIRFFLLELGGIRPSNPGLKLSDYPRLSFIARNAHRLLQLMVHPSKLVKALRLSPSVVAAISSRNKHKLRELKKLIFS